MNCTNLFLIHDVLASVQGEFIVFIDDTDDLINDFVSTIIIELYVHKNTNSIIFDNRKENTNECVEISNFHIEYKDLECVKVTPLSNVVWRVDLAKQHRYSTIISDIESIDSVIGKYIHGRVIINTHDENNSMKLKLDQKLYYNLLLDHKNPGHVTKSNIIPHELKFSIVMAYYNRKEQLIQTLNGFEQQYFGK